MSEDGTGAHTITEEEKIIFIHIWKAVNSEPEALGRKTELQVTQNTETKKDNQRIILWESCKRVIMKELTLGLVFCSAVPKEEKQPGLLTNRFLQLTGYY